MSEVASKVPQLRFPEFSGDWEEKSVGDVLTIGSGRDYKHLNDGDIPVYGTGGYMTSVDNFLYDGESVCIGRKGTIDKPVLINGKFWTVDTLFYTHSFVGLLPKFLFPIFKRINWKKYNEASGVPSLSKSTIEKIKLNLPLKVEQQKIAAFLTAVDTKIEQLSKKQELLGEYKKGLMQKIFSQAIRFKADDGSDFPDWKEKRLGDVINTIKNGTSINQNSSSSGYQVTRIETISTGKINLNKVGYVDTDEDLSGYKLQYGDILFSNINSPAHIGKVAYVGREMDLYHGMNLLLIRANHTILNPEFLYLFLIRKNTRRYFQRICNKAVNQASINQTDLKKTPIIFPGLEEQTKIANFLSSIDNKIEQVGKQLDESKQFKKALLQQMFV